MREYSLAELLDHPGLGLVMTSKGIEPRCLELMLDGRRRDRRRAEADGLVVIPRGVRETDRAGD